jgi:lipoprotein-releasing system ATP-binding protein
MQIIKSQNIHKAYGSLKILKGVSLDVNQGEMVSIVGKSGAGKSTLLHILGTLDKADEGSLIICDKDVASLNEKSLANFRNRNIGFIFQFHHLLPEFTALENICIPAYIRGANQTETLKKAKKLLEYLQLSERAHHKPSELSGGEAQRVAVARALINDPAIIFADEPSGNLDKSSSDNLHNLFVDLKKDFNTTLVIVTHNLDLAMLSDRTIQMIDGLIS